MTLPLMFPPQPSGVAVAQVPVGTFSRNFATGLLATVDGWSFPLALLWPLEPLFTGEAPMDRENFLAGLQADNFLGAGVLPVAGRRKSPLAWIGIELGNRATNPFAEVRGGCWVPGQPAIGRGRELLRSMGMADAAGLAALLVEVGFDDGPGPAIYFNFHHDPLPAECERVYLLDSSTRRLHGFARPCSALAPKQVK